MPGPWITDPELKQKVGDILKKDPGTLAPYWDGHIGSANTDAAADITAILLGKGFSIAQIDAWDNRKTYNTDIALYLALVKGGALAEYDQTTIDKLDRRQMLTDATSLMINGAIVTPGASDSGVGATGGIIDDSCYRFNMNTRF